jgi:predicted dehydrogenase
MKRKLRIGVVGLGMGRYHLRQYKENPHVEIAAISDMDDGRLQSAAQEFGVSSTFSDPESMFSQGDLDGVSIAVPNAFHAPLTIAALKAGLHVLCEKPMAMSVAEAKKMEAAARKAGRNLMINFSYRFSPMSFALKQQVDAGVVGDIYFGRTVWHRRRGMPGFGGWFGTKALSGGGPLIDLGVHRLDLALWLMGYPDPVSVSGSTFNKIAGEIAKKEKKTFDVEDLACGLVKFSNGATLILEASWALHNNENETMITTLHGTKGGLTQRNVGGGYEFAAELYTEEGGSFYTKRFDRPNGLVPSPYDEFVNSILEKRPPMATAEHGIKVQKILEGIYRSAQEGREIRYTTQEGAQS